MATPRGSATAKHKACLEIIPDSHFVVFAGTEHEATSTKLTGVVRLHCPDATSISKPRIRLEGRRKISWVHISPAASSVVEDKRTFMKTDRKLGSIESTHKVSAGIIEWPFEFDLSPQMPESVEGLQDSFIAYHLHASVSRPGWNQRDITTREHIRIIRTLGNDSMESTRSRVNADIWANKLSYSISIPSDAIIFGTAITADVELSPIRKGIRLGRVEMKLIETVIKRISDGNDTSTLQQRGDKANSEESEVARNHMDFPESTKITYDGETSDDPVVADEMYKFQATLKLPKSLHACRQDVDSHQINITHRFKLMVNIHNPEGHVSQLVCRLPIKIFISPNYSIDESTNEVRICNATAAANALAPGGIVVAPPQYGQHRLDQIFSDIDPAGYMSRAGSDPNTPAGLMARSRRGSEDNLRSLDSELHSDFSSAHGSAVPAALLSRLTDLQETDATAPGRESGNTSRSQSASPRPSALQQQQSSSQQQVPLDLGMSNLSLAVQQSRQEGAGQHESHRSSDEQQEQGPQPFDVNDLSRVPSYNAAIRTPGPSTSYGDHPPSYLDATSRPPSPQPQQWSSHSSRGPSRTNSMAAMGGSSPNTRARHDDDSRLRMLRAGS